MGCYVDEQWIGVKLSGTGNIWTPKSGCSRKIGLYACLLRSATPSFHPRGELTVAELSTVRGLSHTWTHFISILFLWSRCFLSPFYWGGNWNSDGFNDWSEMPLLLRGRVRIGASEPVLWAAEAQWWNPVQRSLWEDPRAGFQCSWRGVCGAEAGLALVVMVDDRPLYNMWSQVFF